jgi:hypothetical protein
VPQRLPATRGRSHRRPPRRLTLPNSLPTPNFSNSLSILPD